MSDTANVPQPQIISQIDSSIKSSTYKKFTDDEEERGIMPYPGEGKKSGFSCLRFICCIADPKYRPPLLGPQSERSRGRKTLVLDLDETLVHSSFEQTPLADYQIPLELEEGIPPRIKKFEVFVIKRPAVEAFLKAVGEIYEVIVFTASIERYASPLLNMLDKEGVIEARLYRESCTEYRASYVKDLSRLGRDIRNVIIVDNSPAAYQFQPENAIGCLTFIDNSSDTELDYCRRFLCSPEVTQASDVRNVLGKYNFTSAAKNNV